jgi:hypothetical protein
MGFIQLLFVAVGSVLWPPCSAVSFPRPFTITSRVERMLFTPSTAGSEALVWQSINDQYTRYDVAQAD